MEAAGVSSVTTTTELPIKGEQVDITTTLFNNENTELAVSGIDFMVDGKIIHTATAADLGFASVATGKTQSYTFNYTYDGVGEMEVKAIVHATFEGSAREYQGTLSMTYVDEKLVTKVVIDGTHGNDYVAGYYGGNMGNFTALAAAEYVQVKVITDEITADILADCDFLIISAPAKKTGTSNGYSYVPTHFEDDFIALVKDYVDAGGDLLLCGIADYQDTADAQTSTEMNKLLAAIGATSKLNSDEAVDDENNGGSAYRLYVTTVNEESELMEGMVT